MSHLPTSHMTDLFRLRPFHWIKIVKSTFCPVDGVIGFIRGERRNLRNRGLFYLFIHQVLQSFSIYSSSSKRIFFFPLLPLESWSLEFPLPFNVFNIVNKYVMNVFIVTNVLNWRGRSPHSPSFFVLPSIFVLPSFFTFLPSFLLVSPRFEPLSSRSL